MVNPQSRQNQAAGSVNSTLSLINISELGRRVTLKLDRKEKPWVQFDSKIIAFSTSLQMRKLETCYCFVMATKLQL